MARTIFETPNSALATTVSGKQDALSKETNSYTTSGYTFKYTKFGPIVWLTITGTSSAAIDSDTLVPSTVPNSKYKPVGAGHYPAYYEGYNLHRIYLNNNGQIKFADGVTKSKTAHVDIVYLANTI